MNKPADKAPVIGKYMIVAAWVLVLALLTLFFNDRLEQQRNPNRSLKTTTADGMPEVQLKRNRFGHYVATGSINGQDVEFMLDTGASVVSVPVAVA